MQGDEIEPIGAVKIKDGLFMGDIYASQDIELLLMNKVTYIINCAGRELPNHWESYGIIYLTLPWQETDYQVLFEGKMDVLVQVHKIIDTAINRGESILVHSARGQNRCCCLVAAYCMKKFKWTLNKTMEYLQLKRPTMTIRPNFFQQLMNLEAKLSKAGVGAKTYDWDTLTDDRGNLGSEELLLTNTFINSKPFPIADYNDIDPEEKSNKITWVDHKIPGRSLGSVISMKEKGRKFTNPLQKTSLIFKEETEKACIKSILKGSEKVFIVQDRAKVNGKNPADKNEAKNGDGSPVKFDPTTRKVARNLRPGSAMISNGKQKMLKSSSTPILQRPPAQNIKGSYVYVNFNHSSASGNTTEDQRANQAQREAKGSAKAGLLLGSPNKELDSIFVKPFSLQTTSPYNDGQKDFKSIMQRGDNMFITSQNTKINNFQKNTNTGPINPLVVYGAGSSKQEVVNNKAPTGQKKMTQSMRGFRITESKPEPIDRLASPYSPNFAMLKHVNQGRNTPTRATESNFILKNKKKTNRPGTAPNSSSKKEAQELRTSLGQFSKGINQHVQENRTDGFVAGIHAPSFPQDNKTNLTKAKFRSFSPAEPSNNNTRSYPPNFFETFKVKLEF